MAEPKPIEAAKLRPLLHEKIEQMDAEHLALVNRVLLQVEAEELAERLHDDFDADRQQGRLQRASEIVKRLREKHQYA